MKKKWSETKKLELVELVDEEKGSQQFLCDKVKLLFTL